MNTYKTDDLALSGYLITIGFELSGLEKREGSEICNFVFPMNEQLPVAASMFYNGGASVNPLPYSKTLKQLKNIIYEYKNSNGRPLQERNAKRS